MDDPVRFVYERNQEIPLGIDCGIYLDVSVPYLLIELLLGCSPEEFPELLLQS